MQFRATHDHHAMAPNFTKQEAEWKHWNPDAGTATAPLRVLTIITTQLYFF